MVDRMPFLYGLIAAIGAYYALRYHIAWPVIFAGVEQSLAAGVEKFDASDQARSGITQAGWAARTANTYLHYSVNFGAFVSFVVASIVGKMGWLATLFGAVVGTAAGGALAYLIGTGYLR